MNALHVAVHVDRHAWAPSDAVAKPVPALANRNLLRREDAANRLSGVLGISLARAQEPLAVSKMDAGDGALRKADVQENCVILYFRNCVIERPDAASAISISKLPNFKITQSVSLPISRGRGAFHH